MSSFEQTLATVKEQIDEVTVEEVYRDWVEFASNADTHLIDIRERDEFTDGYIDGADFIPRGLLELKIENQIPDKSDRVILYCGGGTRSALGAKALQQLGYENVESMEGGISAWKDAGYPIDIPKTLDEQQTTRYKRHLTIPEIGEEGQLELLDTKVALLGAGGLGSPAAYYLAAAGVGTLGIIDNDIVDRSNLQRQILHTDDRVGTSKVESAAKSLNALNPDIQVETYDTRLTKDNILDILDGYDIVVDGGDNFPTRYLINDACVRLDTPIVHGSVFRFEGQVSTFVPSEGPCYRCLYPEPPPAELAPSCQEAGVLGVLPGVIGLLQAIEVIKLAVDIGDPLVGRLLTFDGLKTKFRELNLEKNEDCPVCSDDPEITEFIEYEEFCNVA